MLRGEIEKKSDSAFAGGSHVNGTVYGYAANGAAQSREIPLANDSLLHLFFT
jgi:hypothetical protein